MKKNFKVNLEKFKDEDDLNLFLDFIERNKNKIKIIHNNQIKPLENKLITNKSKIKLILLNNPFNYQSFQMKYNIRDLKHKDKDEYLSEISDVNSEEFYGENEYEDEAQIIFKKENNYEDKYMKSEVKEDEYLYKMKYKIRDIKYEGKVKNKDKNIKIFGEKFVKNNYSKCFIMYKDIIFPLKDK